MIQLDLFEDKEKTLILEEIRKVRQSSENVRRGVFARIKELEDQIRQLREEKASLI